jgi:PD-(D/E)XK nuclease superfamily
MPFIQMPSTHAKDRRQLNVITGGDARGPTEYGSTYYDTLFACPREFALRYIAGLAPQDPGDALVTGQLFHYVLQKFYETWMDQQTDSDLQRGCRDGMRAAFAVLDMMSDEPGYFEIHDVVHRMISKYFELYSMGETADQWRILGAEEELHFSGSKFRASLRADLIVFDERVRGLLLVEHKSAGTVNANLIDGYQTDLQVLGLLRLFQLCVDVSKYPPLYAAGINIVSKQKTPVVARANVLPSADSLKAYEIAMMAWYAMRSAYAKQGWPQKWGHCAGHARGYGRCQFYELCSSKPLQTVDEWKHAEVPPKYVRIPAHPDTGEYAQT